MNGTWCHCGETWEDYVVCFWVPTCVAAVGKKMNTEESFLYSKKGFHVQKKDIFNSAPKLFYDVK